MQRLFLKAEQRKEQTKEMLTKLFSISKESGLIP